jgi:hypothetical protein
MCTISNSCQVHGRSALAGGWYKQLPRRASCSPCWVTSRIANSCRETAGFFKRLSARPLVELQTAVDRETAGFCKRISQLGHKQNCKQLPRDSWVLQAARPFWATSRNELQTAAERQLDFASGSPSRATSRIANSC